METVAQLRNLQERKITWGESQLLQLQTTIILVVSYVAVLLSSGFFSEQKENLHMEMGGEGKTIVPSVHPKLYHTRARMSMSL
jgi:hypothetical protein